MNNELVDHVMQIADSYRDARLPESAAMYRENLAAVIGQIQQINMIISATINILIGCFVTILVLL